MADHGVGKRFSATGGFYQPANHGAQSHQQRHRAQSGAKAFGHGGHNALEWNARGQRRERRDHQQGEKSVELEIDDQHQNHGNGGHRNA